jgi:sulfate transport system ATP-binding protein
MALARALAVEPTVLLLDEPFGALDAKVRKELRDWLRRLHDEVHVTTVFVTHDQEEALEVADEIVVINDGKIEQIGPPDELYDAPANDFVMSFLGPVSRLRDELIRPHDIDVFITSPAVGDAVSGEVTRLLRVGFEVRLWVRPLTSAPDSAGARGAGEGEVAGPGEEDDVSVVLTRSHARELDLQIGSKVWLAANPGATRISPATR